MPSPLSGSIHATTGVSSQVNGYADVPVETEPRRIPMASGGQWTYRPHDMGDHPRGLYRGGSQFMAALPFVHARIIRMSGSGRPTGTDYLMSGTLDGTRVIISDELLRTGEWAPVLDMALSADDKIQKAAATAIRDMAHRDAARTTPTPRPQPDGMLSIPVPEALPDGYLATAPVPPEVALKSWFELVMIAARGPEGKMALALGASAFGPFMLANRIQTHMIDAAGEAGRGKSTMVRQTGAVWGDSITKGAGVVIPWDVSAIGVGRHAGALGCLPMFLDESGMCGMDAMQRAQFMLRLAESGGARMVAERIGTGTRRGLPWIGVVINSGNGAFIDQRAVAGRLAGVLRRVIAMDTATPFTATGQDSERSDELVGKAYGHLGHWILRRYSVPKTAELIEWATGRLGGLPEESHARNITKILASHVAGAAMVDQVCGTGTVLQDAAIAGARAYLADRGRTPDSDADRLLDAIREAIQTTPGDWPTRSEYDEWHRARPEHVPGAGSDRRELPQHGVNRSVAGIRADDGSWLVVAPTTWHGLMDELGTDAAMVCRVLARNGLIHVAKSLRDRGEWRSYATVEGGRFGGYRISLPPADDDTPEPPAETRPAAPAPDPAAEYVQRCVEALRTSPTLADLDLFPWSEIDHAVTAGRIGADVVGQLRDAATARRRDLTADAAPAPDDVPLFAPGSQDPSPAAQPAPQAVPVPGPRTAPERRSHRTTDLPQLDMTPVEKARGAETPEKAENAVVRAAIKEGMRLMEACRVGGKYSFVVRPPMPPELKKPSPKSPDVVWECRPKWTNPAIEVGTMVDRLDTNAAYCSALKAWLPIGHLERVEGSEYDPKKHSGILLITPPEWKHADMPDPLGAREEPGRVWVPDSVVRQYLRLAAEGRCESPAIHEALVSGTTENLLEKFRITLAQARMKAIQDGDALTETYVKAIYSKVISTMGESTANWQICRQDWMHIIRAQAYMNLWRKADAARKAGLIVAKVSNTDELHVVGQWRKSADGSGVFEEGRALDQMKSKGSYAWGVKGNE